jgi:hypothetical protein
MSWRANGLSPSQSGKNPIHPTRNFATLGPSELRPPFTGPSVETIFGGCFSASKALTLFVAVFFCNP